MCNTLAPAWAIDNFIAFDLPIIQSTNEIIAYVNKTHGS